MDVKFYDPMNKILYEERAVSFGDQVFNAAMAGDYRACFVNSFTTKVIDFDLTLAQDDDYGKGASDASGPGFAPKLSTFEESLSKLKVDLRYLQAYQRYFKNRDARNQMTVEGTEQLVFWFSILVSLLIMGMSALQVYILRRFFTTSGKVRI